MKRTLHFWTMLYNKNCRELHSSVACIDMPDNPVSCGLNSLYMVLEPNVNFTDKYTRTNNLQIQTSLTLNLNAAESAFKCPSLSF